MFAHIAGLAAGTVLLIGAALPGAPGNTVPAGGDDARAYLVELHAPPAAKVYAAHLAAKADARASVAATRAHLEALEAAQGELIRALGWELPDVPVLYQVRRVLNGVAVIATGEEAAEIERIPGVARVSMLPVLYPSLTTSVPFIEAQRVWGQESTGFTGRGVRIGIIDTGIDYLHPNFGGPGTPAAYQQNSRIVIGDAPYPNEKVVGGFDFAGEYYNPGDSLYRVPIPDPDPTDTRGHGTHVASIAAGYGITILPTRHPGPYEESTDFSRYLIGPGVAPEALLYALKVFGDTGGTNLVPQAIDWAVDPDDDGDFSDHLDVINLSLGAAYAVLPDTMASACDSAVQVGVIVCISAGNNGDVFFVLDTPGASPRALCVAASEDLDDTYTGASAPLIPDTLATFSSRGPVPEGQNAILKPDLCAPGVGITAARALAVNRETLAIRFSGTSMAAPHVAGVMALLREQHPDWTAAELKALVMNTATHDVYLGEPDASPRAGTSRVGAGRVNAAAAAAAEVIVFNAVRPDLVSLPFRTKDVRDFTRETLICRVVNKGANTVRFEISLDSVIAAPGVALRLYETDTGPIAPGASVEFPVILEATASAMKHVRGADVGETQLGFPRQWMTEVSGYVTLTPYDAGPRLRLAYYAAPRPAAAVRAATSVLDVSASSRVSLDLIGDGFEGPNPPVDVVSLVTPAALMWVSPQAQNPFARSTPGDLRYVGIQSDYHDVNRVTARTTVSFAIAAFGEWHTPASGYYLVRVDINRDGWPDYTVYNGIFWEPFSEVPFQLSDILVTVRGLWDSLYQGLANGLPINYFSPDVRDTVAFRGSVLVLPISAHSLGLRDSGRSSFDFWVDTFFSERAFRTGIPDDRSAVLYHDIKAPGLRFPDGNPAPPRRSRGGDSIVVEVDSEAYAHSKTKGVLLLHHHNRIEDRAEWVKVITDGDSDLDGIPDVIEGVEDFDGDGAPNLLDPDADGDTLLDKDEGTDDVDGDGWPNFLDLDSDGDGIPDRVESLDDADRDGNPNAYDFDSDGDGVLDAIEGADDADGDGVPNCLDLDADGDTLPDWFEGIDDIDGDGVPSFLDLDSDGDGLCDYDEANVYFTNPYDRDTDGDGIDDGDEIARGTDPLTAEPPPPTDSVRATIGAYADRVQVWWTAVPGKTTYRVYRTTTDNPDTAIPVSNWIAETVHVDYTADSPREQRVGGCSGYVTEFTYYTYFVKARNPGGESLWSAGAVGCRGGPATR
ncbi:MAG TPA: S8 family serine peptidase [Candidatus Hydrogenedentes bacterium]|nr:S8 family serine peptidase [Candidatus Hydrogenedentota bacterium]